MKRLSWLALLALLSLQVIAHADGYDRAWHRAHWNQGHWIHDRHNGQLGWWWVVGPSWTYFVHPISQPPVQTVIIQQAPAAPPAQVIVQAPPPAAFAPAPVANVSPTLYYCKATGTYYPETMTCPNGWTPIIAGAPPAP